jgi:AraC-like DNA-binding protein
LALHISILNVFLSFVFLLHNWRVNRNSVFISVLILLISTFSITHYLVIHASSRFWLAVTFNNQTALWCLIGPSLYFYIRSVLTDRLTFKTSDLLHTIPFWITLIGIFPYLLTPFEYKLSVADLIIHNISEMKRVKVNWLVPQEINLLVRPILQITYAIVCLFILLRFHQRRKFHGNRPLRQTRFVFRWLLSLTIFVLLTGIYYLWALIAYYSSPDFDRTDIYQYQALYFVGVSLISMPLMMIIFPKILYGIPKYPLAGKGRKDNGLIKQDALDPDIGATSSVDISGEEGYDSAKEMEDEPFNALAERMISWMEEKKPFLELDFSLESLADQLEVPKHHLYYCFRNILKTKFTTLRTQYRIEHAKQLLREADLRSVTLDAIGQASGFASRSGFYKTFKDEVGCSPGEFLEAELKKNGGPAV